MKNYGLRIWLMPATSFLLAMSASAQSPSLPASPDNVSTTKVSSTIAQLNYGPDGDVDGFLAGNGTLVHVPPAAVAQFGRALRAGNAVTYSGYAHTGITGRMVVDTEALTVNGETVVIEPARPSTPSLAPRPAGPPMPPPPPTNAGPGVQAPPPPPPPQP